MCETIWFGSLYLWEVFDNKFNLFNTHKAIHIFCFLFQLWEFILQEIQPFCLRSIFDCINFFIILFFIPFHVCRICNSNHSRILNIGNFSVISYFLEWSRKGYCIFVDLIISFGSFPLSLKNTVNFCSIQFHSFTYVKFNCFSCLAPTGRTLGQQFQNFFSCNVTM